MTAASPSATRPAGRANPATPSEWADDVSELLLTHSRDPLAVAAKVARHGVWSGVWIARVDGVRLVGEDRDGFVADVAAPLLVTAVCGWVLRFDGARFVVA